MTVAPRPRVLILNENESVPHDRRVWEISTSLTRAGYEVVVVSPEGHGSEAEPFEVRDGIVLHRYPPPPAGSGAVGYAREYATALWHTWRLVRRLRRDGDFALVHACNPPDFLLLAARSLRRRGARFVFDHHDLVPELYLSRFERGRDVFYRLSLAFERLAFRLADVVIATNESYRAVALSRGRKRQDDVFVVRNAPDTKRFRRGEPDEGLRRGKRHLIAYVGVMGPQDGVDYGLRALARLKERRDDWHALFVGDGEMQPAMRELAAQLGLEDCVEFTGWAEPDAVVRVLSTADVCLAPEPPSPLNDVSTLMKIAEYMAMSCPIVSFDLPETRFTAGEAAFYAPGNDEEAFARGIDELLADPARRAAMGAAGRERVVRDLSWTSSEQALLAAYAHALRDGAAVPKRQPEGAGAAVPSASRRR
jgi:glycosyltransferase involved in cell wall biosynthesis